MQILSMSFQHILRQEMMRNVEILGYAGYALLCPIFRPTQIRGVNGEHVFASAQGTQLRAFLRTPCSEGKNLCLRHVLQRSIAKVDILGGTYQDHQ